MVVNLCCAGDQKVTHLFFATGTINLISGEINLLFSAEFRFRAHRLYEAPPLLVDTILTTENSQGDHRQAKGHRLDLSGHAKLVGVAHVPKVNDPLTDVPLMLPADALAILSAQFQFE